MNTRSLTVFGMTFRVDYYSRNYWNRSKYQLFINKSFLLSLDWLNTRSLRGSSKAALEIQFKDSEYRTYISEDGKARW
ncbi:MAG: hypothetical protein ACJ748_03340 [Flavisolibacter sp.]